MAGQSILELLFKIRAEFEGEDKVIEDVNKLAAAFGKPGQAIDQITAKSTELFDILHDKGIGLLDQEIEKLSEHLPVIGPAVSSLSSKFLELGESGKAVTKLQDDISKIATASGNSTEEVRKFLTEISSIKDASEKSDQVLTFLGTNLATKLLPSLETAAKGTVDLGEGIISAAKAAGKSDEEIANFVKGLANAGSGAETFGKLVGFVGEEAAKKLLPAMQESAKAIETVAKVSGLSIDEVTNFVKEFASLGTAAEKQTFAVARFGETIAKEVAPELASASKVIQTSTGQTLAFVEAINSAVGALGPYGIALVGIVIGLAAFAAATVAAVEVTKEIGEKLFETAEAAAAFRNQLLITSQQTNISVETLSSLELAVSGAGVSIQGLSQSIVQFQRQLEQSKDLTSDQAALFQELGVTSHDTETAFKQTLKGLNNLGEGTKQTTIAMQLFGRTGRSLINILKETDGDIDAVVKKAHELGIAVSGEDAEAAHKFTEALDALELQFRALVGNDLIPVVTQAMEDFSKILVENKDVIQGFNTAITAVAQLLIGLLKPYLDGAILAMRLFNLSLQAGQVIAVELFRVLLPLYNVVKTLGEAFDKASGLGERHAEVTKEDAEAQKELAAATAKAAQSSAERVKSLDDEITFLESLIGKTKRSAEENGKLNDAYASLTPSARKRIKEIQDEDQAIQELIKTKNKQRAQVEQEAAETEAQKQKASGDFNIDQIRAQSKAAIEEAKRQEDEAKRNFENGKIRRAQLRDAQIADAAEQRKQAKLIADEDEKQAQRTYNVAKAQAGTNADLAFKAEKAITDAKQKARLDREKAEKDFDTKEAGIRHEFQKQEIQDQQAQAQRSLDLSQEKLNLQQKILQDALKHTAQETKPLFETQDVFRSVDEVQKKILESVLQRSDITIATRKKITAQLAQLDAEQIANDKKTSAELLNILIESNTKQRVEADQAIKNQEDALLSQKKASIEARLGVGSQSERKVAADDLRKFEIERTSTTHEQEERRLQIYRDERDQRAAILVSSAVTTNQIFQDEENKTIEGIQRLADERVLTEEQATTKIIEIRKHQIEANIALNEVEQTHAKVTIEDAKALADRLNELKQQQIILIHQRTEIEENAVVQIEDAHQRSIENERRFQDEIDVLAKRATASRIEAAKTIVSVLELTGVRRIEILRKQTAIERAEESERHAQRLKDLDDEREILDEHISLLQTRLDVATILGKEETEEYKNITTELERLRSRRALLNRQEESEETQHAFLLQKTLSEMINSGLFTRSQLVAQFNIEKAQEDKRHRDKLDDLKRQKDELEKQGELNAIQLAQLKKINHDIEEENRRHAGVEAVQTEQGKEANAPDFIKGFTDSLGLGESKITSFAAAMKELGATGGDIVKGLAQGVGQLVSNYVLLGTTGPAALRKLLAATLAQVAGEAAVKAILWTAQGIADLFWNPARAGADFAAAALFGSIAGVAAITGRALAGNLFQQSNTGGNTPGGGANGSTTTQTPSPIDLTRQQQPTDIHIFVHAEPGPHFNAGVVTALVHDIRHNGDARQIIVDTANS